MNNAWISVLWVLGSCGPTVALPMETSSQALGTTAGEPTTTGF